MRMSDEYDGSVRLYEIVGGVQWRVSGKFKNVLGTPIHTYSMNTYPVLHFEHKNDVTVIVKL